MEKGGLSARPAVATLTTPYYTIPYYTLLYHIIPYYTITYLHKVGLAIGRLQKMLMFDPASNAVRHLTSTCQVSNPVRQFQEYNIW